MNKIVTEIKDGKTFLIMTHQNPDADAIGSMLALGKALQNCGKEVVLFADKPLPSPMELLAGSDLIVQNVEENSFFDKVVILDCGDLKRLGGNPGLVKNGEQVINIDHHESNVYFGDLNLVDKSSSSTGELVYEILKKAELPVTPEIAENLFAAIQTDTGSFKYSNTTASCLKIAGELVEAGAVPGLISRKMIDCWKPARLKLLELSLATIEYHFDDKLATMNVTLDMFRRTCSSQEDSDRFIDFPRFVKGVEVALFIRQTDEKEYKFSLRSNGNVNVAQLSSKFGGGGHAMAAGYSCRGDIETLKKNFLEEIAKSLDGKPH